MTFKEQRDLDFDKEGLYQFSNQCVDIAGTENCHQQGFIKRLCQKFFAGFAPGGVIYFTQFLR